MSKSRSPQPKAHNHDKGPDHDISDVADLGNLDNHGLSDQVKHFLAMTLVSSGRSIGSIGLRST